MKFWIGLLLLALTFAPVSFQVQAQTPTPDDEPAAGAVVCDSQAYYATPDDCLLAGPSAYLTGLAQIGLTLPPRPLPASPPDPSLTQIPYRYFHFEKKNVPAYPSLQDAQAKSGNAQIFPPGFVYISYNDRIDTGQGIFYMAQAGFWVAGMGERVSEVSQFQGLVFHETPGNDFGWTFEQIPVKLGPGYNAPDTGQVLNPFTVVQIYYTLEAEGTTWNMIGIDQWVEGRKVAQVTPNTKPPEGVTTGRWIDVNLAEQTLAVYDNSSLVYATVIATGMEPFWTRPGTFQIFQKKETETMRNNDPTDFYFLEDVPYTMYFDGARALHAAYWRTRFGYPQSHGCVNLSVGDAHWLFNWAHEGDWVYVHDPSGQTPTDPSLYKGGAY